MYPLNKSAVEGGSLTIEAHASSEATLAYVNPAAPAPIGQLCVDIASLAQQLSKTKAFCVYHHFDLTKKIIPGNMFKRR